MAITLTVNGEIKRVNADGDTPLLWVLRDELRLTGTKYGCGVAQCGACTVQINGNAVRSCIMPVKTLEGKKITTIEGLDDSVAEAVKAAWVDINVPQCGYCQSGQVVSATTLLQKIENPSEKDIDLGMTGNICRCATYPRIKSAIQQAATELNQKRQQEQQRDVAFGTYDPQSDTSSLESLS